jgi:hypothetical protein
MHAKDVKASVIECMNYLSPIPLSWKFLIQRLLVLLQPFARDRKRFSIKRQQPNLIAKAGCSSALSTPSAFAHNTEITMTGTLHDGLRALQRKTGTESLHHSEITVAMEQITEIVYIHLSSIKDFFLWHITTKAFITVC